MSYMHNALKRYAQLRGVKSKRYRKPKKLREETRELIEAMRLHKKRRSMKSKMHLMEEVADVQWCLTAIADEAGFTVEDALDLKILRDRGRNL